MAADFSGDRVVMVVLRDLPHIDLFNGPLYKMMGEGAEKLVRRFED